MKRQPVAGFTLIELLVVVAIIALLASITLPAFVNMSRSNRFKICSQNLHDIGVALALYHADYGVYPAGANPDYLRSRGKDWVNIPFSKKAQIAILSQPKPTVLEVPSLNGLEIGFNITVRDRKDFPLNTEWKTITDIKTTTSIPTTYELTLDSALINSFDANGFIEVPGRLSFALTSGIAPNEVAIPIPNNNIMMADSISAQCVPGLTVTLKQNAIQQIRTGTIIGSQVTTDANNQTIVSVAFSEPVNLATDNTPAFYSAGGSLELPVGNFGLSTLYYLYLNDEKNYLRNITLFHCPELRGTLNVDRGMNLNLLRNLAGQDPTAYTAYRQFDPLWSGYNTYDVTYNYSQFADVIRSFDQVLDYGDVNSKRQLQNPNAPADTVVCWCYGHGGQSVVLGDDYAGSDVKNVQEIHNGQPVTVQRKITTFARLEQQKRSSRSNLVLWLDGTVSPVAPYLMKKRQTNLSNVVDPNNPVADQYYWVPSCLYTLGDMRR